MEELAKLNPCIKFIIDNYDMLCLAHPGMTVMVVDSRVVRTFPSMIDAMMFTEAVGMENVAYAMKECNGSDVCDQLIYSTACQSPN